MVSQISTACHKLSRDQAPVPSCKLVTGSSRKPWLRLKTNRETLPLSPTVPSKLPTLQAIRPPLHKHKATSQSKPTKPKVHHRLPTRTPSRPPKPRQLQPIRLPMPHHNPLTRPFHHRLNLTKTRRLPSQLRLKLHKVLKA